MIALSEGGFVHVCMCVCVHIFLLQATHPKKMHSGIVEDIYLVRLCVSAKAVN